jgi:hypothetical protein
MASAQLHQSVPARIVSSWTSRMPCHVAARIAHSLDAMKGRGLRSS